MKTVTALLFFLTLGMVPGGGELFASEAAERVDHFLFALQRGKWKQAYSDLSPVFRQQCGGTANSLGEKVISTFESRATEWEISETKVAKQNATIVAQVQRENGKLITTGLALSRSQDRWMIDAVDVAGKELCPWQKTARE